MNRCRDNATESENERYALEYENITPSTRTETRWQEAVAEETVARSQYVVGPLCSGSKLQQQ